MKLPANNLSDLSFHTLIDRGFWTPNKRGQVLAHSPSQGLSWGWLACSSPDPPSCPSWGQEWHFLSSISRELPQITMTFQKLLRVTLQWHRPAEKHSEVREDLTCHWGLQMRSWWRYFGSSALEGWKACVILDTVQKHGWHQCFGKPPREPWFSYRKYCLYLSPSF